jgi:hypothetical protein
MASTKMKRPASIARSASAPAISSAGLNSGDRKLAARALESAESSSSTTAIEALLTEPALAVASM